MNKIAVAKELASIARELVGAKFDTKKELDEYKREHGQRPGTRLQVRNKHEMQERYKDKKAVVGELIAVAKSLVATRRLSPAEIEAVKSQWPDVKRGKYKEGHWKSGMMVRLNGKKWYVWELQAERDAPDGILLVLISPDFTEMEDWVRTDEVDV
jgi:hypothetical protein